MEETRNILKLRRGPHARKKSVETAGAFPVLSKFM